MFNAGNFLFNISIAKLDFEKEKKSGSGGIRTHAIEMTGALNQRLRPLGHATNCCVPSILGYLNCLYCVIDGTPNIQPSFS